MKITLLAILSACSLNLYAQTPSCAEYARNEISDVASLDVALSICAKNSMSLDECYDAAEEISQETLKSQTSGQCFDFVAKNNPVGLCKELAYNEISDDLQLQQALETCEQQ